ncbi:class I SAM-dependent methyltransferase [Geodermatophilus sabuli]|uniref:class I SAM-dependent methyltransferase n=1 Tax=Geodermatophilus sabuli TaxID=1564158 RepID=UPI00179F00B8|nr:class I SAM-dependent methyltransferase [Geodermatophilus sabuli]MBB3082688.1 SAM-dependent methyltransferase [Geodermatophilus sabuli]
MGEPVPAAGPWAGAAGYEAYVGRWSRAVAPRFLAWLGVPAGRAWLDVGCGTGALTEAVLAGWSPASVVGVDPSPAFLASARSHVPDGRASFREVAAQALPLHDESVDAVVSGLVLNFVPDRPAGLAEMRRVVRPGGVVAAYVWDYADGMQLIRLFWDAAVDLDPAARDLDEGRRFGDCRPGPLRDLFLAAGFDDVEVEGIVVPTVFADRDDHWTPFLGGTGPAPAYVASLGEDRRTALREGLRARLTPAPDGSIHLSARAWAVRGRRG